MQQPAIKPAILAAKISNNNMLTCLLLNLIEPFLIPINPYLRLLDHIIIIKQKINKVRWI